MEDIETRRRRRLARVFAILPLVLLLFAGLVWAVMTLWNWLMPAIFGVRAVTYWQALGLMALTWILFRGFHGPAMRREPWRRDLRERWRTMTPQQREDFMQALRSRWTGERPAPEPKP